MTSNLSPAQVQELKQAFDMFDQDRSGVISRDEMKNVFNALNIKVTQDQVDQCVAQMDTNNSGQVEFVEFARVMAETYFRKYSVEELQTVFRKFDQDSSGYIQKRELGRVFEKLGRAYSDEQIETMIRSLDVSGDGQIGFDEFVKLF